MADKDEKTGSPRLTQAEIDTTMERAARDYAVFAQVASVTSLAKALESSDAPRGLDWRQPLTLTIKV